MNQKKICQSCTMPLENETERGTNKDNTRCEDYCKYCYRGGKFTKPLMTKEEMVDLITSMAKSMGMDHKKVRKMAEEAVPKLKRWA